MAQPGYVKAIDQMMGKMNPQKRLALITACYQHAGAQQAGPGFTTMIYVWFEKNGPLVEEMRTQIQSGETFGCSSAELKDFTSGDGGLFQLILSGYKYLCGEWRTENNARAHAETCYNDALNHASYSAFNNISSNIESRRQAFSTAHFKQEDQEQAASAAKEAQQKKQKADAEKQAKVKQAAEGRLRSAAEHLKNDAPGSVVAFLTPPAGRVYTAKSTDEQQAWHPVMVDIVKYTGKEAVSVVGDQTILRGASSCSEFKAFNKWAQAMLPQNVTTMDKIPAGGHTAAYRKTRSGLVEPYEACDNCKMWLPVIKWTWS